MITSLDVKTALVLIDFQYMNTRRELVHPALEIITRAAALASSFRRAGKLVVVVNVNPAGAPWTKARKEVQAPGPVLTADSFEIDERLLADPMDLYITKKTWNAFYETFLYEELHEMGITGIVLAGISTRIGVEGTARAASELGYNITFAIDAMTDINLESHQNCLTQLFPRMGELGTTEEIIAML